jgi:hypothetical protein
VHVQVHVQVHVKLIRELYATSRRISYCTRKDARRKHKQSRTWILSLMEGGTRSAAVNWLFRVVMLEHCIVNSVSSADIMPNKVAGPKKRSKFNAHRVLHCLRRI